MKIAVRTTALAMGLAAALVGAHATAAQFVPEFFDGGGYGSTEESATASAIEDALNTASIYGLYSCTLTASEVFPGSNALRRFYAQVQLRCR